MSTANTWGKPWRSVMGTLVRVLTFALVIGGIALVPARGQERERHQGHEEHERRRHEWERSNERRRGAYSPYGYYAPPPVVYPPPPPPGINLFFHIP